MTYLLAVLAQRRGLKGSGSVFGGLRPFLLVGLVLLVGGCGSETKSESVPAGDFPVASSFDLADYKGKVLLLNFWGTWCGPCKVELPDLVKLHESFDTDQVSIVGIAIEMVGPEQAQSELRRTAQRYNITYPVIYDQNREMIAKFGNFQGIPTTFLFDAEGKVREVYTGPRSFKVFAKDIQSLLDQS